MTAQSTPSFYPGIFLRNNLQGTNALPSPGPFELCPDIIQSPSPISNFQAVLSSPASYAESFNTQPVLGETSYYYVRGKNGGRKPAAGTVFLYAAPAQLISFPETWQDNPIPSPGSQPPTIEAAADAVAVASSAFVWQDPPAPTCGSDYYTLVARFDDSTHSNPTPTIATWQDMSALATNNLRFGFSNVSSIGPGETSWVRRQMLTIPASLPGPAQLLLTLSISGFAGAVIGLIADTFNTDQKPILIDPVTVPATGSLTFGIDVAVQPGVTTSLAVQCWNEQVPAAGSSIVLSADYVVPPDEREAARARGLIDSGYRLQARPITGAAEAAIEPESLLFLGSCNLVVGGAAGG